MIRIGWIGCGTHFGQMLLSQLVRLDVCLEALCNLDPGRLARVADRYGVTARCTDPATLLAHPGPDAIGMAVGPAQHATLAAEALMRHLPVFIEKPAAPTSVETALLAETARRAGRPCVVGFMKRYSTATASQATSCTQPHSDGACHCRTNT